jgi:hypothetical protein
VPAFGKRKRQRKRRRLEIDLDLDLEPALLLALLLALAAMVFLDRPLIARDGAVPLLWLDSIAMDGDLNLETQVAKFSEVDAWSRAIIDAAGQGGRQAISPPLGMAALFVPFYRIAAWLDTSPAMRVHDAHFVGIQGLPFAYGLCTMLGANLYALAAVVLGYHVARHLASPWLAALAAIAIYLGTPLLFYSTVEPFSEHVVSASSATLLVCLWLRVRDKHAHTLPWLWVGLSAGLAALCRWQMALFVVPIGLELLLHGRWRKVLAFLAGFAILAWVIPFFRWMVSGSPWILSAGPGELGSLMAPLRIWRALASPADGLFPWSPVTLLALVGLLPLLRRDWRLALIAAVMFVLQALSGGTARAWEGGAGFGAGRMAELYPVYVLLLAALLEYLALHERKLLRLAQAVTVACAAYGVVLLLARLSTMWAEPPGSHAGVIETLRYGLSPGRWRLMWPMLREHVGVWAWKKPGT